MNWINVNDKLPEHSNTVLAYFPNGNEEGDLVSTGYRTNPTTIISDYPNSTAHFFKATHWMEMPEPPKN